MEIQGKASAANRQRATIFDNILRVSTVGRAESYYKRPVSNVSSKTKLIRREGLKTLSLLIMFFDKLLVNYGNCAIIMEYFGLEDRNNGL